MANIQKDPKEYSLWLVTIGSGTTCYPSFGLAYMHALMETAKRMRSAVFEITINGKELGGHKWDTASKAQIKKRGWDKLKRPAEGGETC